MYTNVPTPKNIEYIKAFLVALPIITSSLSSLKLYIEKYGIKLRNHRNTVLPSTKYKMLMMESVPRYQSTFFTYITPALFSIAQFMLYTMNINSIIPKIR